MFCILQKTGDLADLRLHARLCDDRNAVASRDEAARKDAVDAIAQGHFPFKEGGSILFSGNAFPRQGRFVHRKAFRREKARVCRHEVAHFEQDDIPRNEHGGIHFPHGAVAHDAADGGRQTAERFQSVFRTPLLRHGENDVHGDDGKDDDRLHKAAPLDDRHDEAEDPRDQQDDHGYILELCEDHIDQLLLFLLFEDVLAVLLPTPFRFRRSEPALARHL